ncbi:efflux transporter outer membrane subunit [Robbsia sp. KACC 23696]|uniref:efflux transporter outer membrane subunit n=1 Tax=Robbsia sp. KACC 23696 TaxID=3149231 RepID=UPI00325C294B
MKNSFLCVCVGVSLSACSLAPKMVRPDAPVPAAFPAVFSATPTMRDASTDNAAAIGWRSMFANRALQQLIERALGNNRNLRVTALNVAAVAAEYRIARSSRLPALAANASSTRQRFPLDAGEYGQAFEGTSASSGYLVNDYTVSVGLSAFEVDLFGRVKSLSDAAKARYFASEEGRMSVQIALIGAVADAYFSYQLATEQLQLTRKTLADWQRSLTLSRALRQAGQTSRLDVAEAESQVRSAEADVEQRIRAQRVAINALRLLVGTDLPDPQIPLTTLAQDDVMTVLPAGVPSDLLLRRPDVRQAEQLLIAANADIGAARAAFFPRLSLTATLGYTSPALRGLFTGDQSAWSFSPQLTLPIFQAGALRAALSVAELRKSVAVAQYEQAIQIAFREVADGLAGRETYGRQIIAQQAVVASAAERVDLADARYRAGFDTRLALLISQRALYSAQDSLLGLHSAALSNAVALYKALGGGVRGDDMPASFPRDQAAANPD